MTALEDAVYRFHQIAVECRKIVEVRGDDDATHILQLAENHMPSEEADAVLDYWALDHVNEMAESSHSYEVRKYIAEKRNEKFNEAVDVVIDRIEVEEDEQTIVLKDPISATDYRYRKSPNFDDLEFDMVQNIIEQFAHSVVKRD